MKKGWEIKTLGDICENLDSKRVPVTKRDRQEGKYPYYGASGIVDYVNKFIFNEDLLLVSEDGANLLARTYPIAFSISGETWVNNHAHVLRFESMTTQKFVEYYLNSIPLDDYVSGMAQPKLNQAMLNSIEIPVPPLPEQQRIVSVLDEAFASIAQAKSNAERNLVNARELFETVMNDVFTSAESEKWSSARLMDVCEKIQDGAHSSPKTTYPEKRKNTYMYITSKNIRNDYMKLSNVEYVDEGFHQSIYPRCNPEFGDVLLTKDGANTGNVTLNTLDEPFSMLSSVCLIKTKKESLSPSFLKFYIQSPVGFKNITGQMAGAAIKRIVLVKIKNSKIPLPPLAEQRVIVGRLEALSAETGRLEEIYWQKVESLEELKKSVLAKAFGGSL